MVGFSRSPVRRNHETHLTFLVTPSYRQKTKHHPPDLLIRGSTWCMWLRLRSASLAASIGFPPIHISWYKQILYCSFNSLFDASWQNSTTYSIDKMAGNPCYALLWLILLVFIAWPVAGLCSGLWIFLMVRSTLMTWLVVWLQYCVWILEIPF